MKKALYSLFLVAALLSPSAHALDPHTNYESFDETAGEANWNAFNWVWASRTERMDLTFDFDITPGNVLIRMFKEEGGDITLEAGPFCVIVDRNATLTISSTNMPVWSSYYTEVVQVDETDPTQYKSLARGTIAREWSSFDTTNFLGDTESVHLLYSYGTNSFLPAIDAAIAVHVTNTPSHAASTISVDTNNFVLIDGTNSQAVFENIDTNLVAIKLIAETAGDLQSTNSPTAQKIMLYADSENPTKTNLYWDVLPYTIEGITNSYFFGSMSNSAKLYMGNDTNSAYFVIKTNELYVGNVATNEITTYAEIDPVWSASSNDYAELSGATFTGDIVLGGSGRFVIDSTLGYLRDSEDAKVLTWSEGSRQLWNANGDLVLNLPTLGYAQINVVTATNPEDAVPLAQMEAAIEPNQREISTDDLVSDDYILLCETTAGAFTLTLTASAANANRLLVIKNIGTNNLTIDANASETIDGETNIVISTQYNSVNLVCDGTEWWIH